MDIPSNATDSEEDDEYTIIGVRRTQHNTSFGRRDTALLVNESIEQRELEEVADTVLSLQSIVHILSNITLTLDVRLHTSTTIQIIIKLYCFTLDLLAFCDNELDVLTHVEVNIRALQAEDRPPLILHPIKNRTIDELDPTFDL